MNKIMVIVIVVAVLAVALLVTFLSVASTVFSNEVTAVQDCAYSDWLCGDQCIRKYEMCNETCPPWYLKCKYKAKHPYTSVCLSSNNICDGCIDCEDGIDEQNCPANCEIQGGKSCMGEPCNEKCLR